MDERKRRLIEKLRKSREYREAFVAEIIDTGVPFQIYALREKKGWTQKELGERTKMAQETISRVEDPNYVQLTLKTLKRLASAFEVGLMVKFVPFSELVESELHLTPDSLKVLSFDEEPYFKERTEEKTDEGINKLKEVPKQPTPPDYSRLIIGVKEGSQINAIYKKQEPFGFQQETQGPAHELMRQRT
jgi:transcriptional regulator with XRE-family HTH domain